MMGEHKNGDQYRYIVGVCMDVSPEDGNYAWCGAVQLDNRTHTHCLGNLSKAQIARSKCVWLLLSVVYSVCRL